MREVMIVALAPFPHRDHFTRTFSAVSQRNERPPFPPPAVDNLLRGHAFDTHKSAPNPPHVNPRMQNAADRRAYTDLGWELTTA